MKTLLGGYRVLDLCTGGGLVCGKILADMGADVIKVEPLSGDPTRNIGPFFGGMPDCNKSLFFFAFNTNKRGITINLESPDGRDIFCKLVDRADILLESYPVGYLDRRGLGYEQLRTINPGLVMTSITPFGQTGPYKDYKGVDMVVWALGGLMNVCGDPDRPPVQVTLPQSYIAAGGYAAEATMVALFHKARTGKGQWVDVSAQATLTWFIAELLPFFELLNQDIKRAGGAITRVGGLLCPVLFPCKDGYISFLIQAGLPGVERNQKTVKWLEEEGLATDYLRKKDWQHWDWAGVTVAELNEMVVPVGKLFIRYTADELYNQAIRRGVSLFPVNTSKDVLENAQLKARGFWVHLRHEELDSIITYPGAFALFSETPLVIDRRSPAIGEHNREVYLDELGLTPDELTRLKSIGAV